ncbi:MAG: DUF1569 domain-containing protein [Gemmatimonas sp.]
MKNIFDAAIVDEQIARINRLTSETHPQWGKMTADQVLAHLNVSYIMTYENTIPKPNWLMRQVLKTIVKQKVVGPTPYGRSVPTAPAFKMVGTKDFNAEKEKLIGYLKRVQQDGEQKFNGRSSHSFGPLTAAEWNNMFYKHLDHHLTQFGV